MTAALPAMPLRVRLARTAAGWAASLRRAAAAPALREIVRSPLFWLVLALKLALGASLASFYLRDLFVPFVNYYVESGFANPWQHFAALGRLNSFPYPPVMLYALAVPRWLLSPLLPAGVDTVSGLHLLAMRLPLLAADLLIALILLRWFPTRVRRVLVYYWASPFVIYIAYWHGQLDLIPTALFLASLALLRRKQLILSMGVFGLALAAKSHLWVALPFVLVYVTQEHGWRRALLGLSALLGVYVLLVAGYLPDPGFVQMVYGTQEQGRLFAFQLDAGAGGLAVLLAPGAIALLWFRFAGYARRNWDLFMLYLGILFCVFILLAPPAPGYFLWSLPFLVHFVAASGRPPALPYLAYALSYLAFFWLGDQSDLFDAWQLVSPALAATPTPYQSLSAVYPEQARLMQNLLFTLMQASLSGIVLSMYLLGVRRNAVYQMRTSPVLIGVAGDSGAGKTTACQMLAQVLGEARLTVINGDDYHRWPRGHEKWQVYTHLNIRGSNVHQQAEHAVAMHAGRSIVKGVYDHASGQFTNPQEIDPSQYIVFSGLHALALDSMRRMFDLKVFLDPDEALRRHWKLERDSAERGYQPEQVAAQLDQRQPDRQTYILPQLETADVVVRLLRGADGDGLALEVQALNGFDLASLADALEPAESLALQLQPFLDSRWQLLRAAGSVSPAQLLEAAQACIPNLPDVARQPRFESGLNGLIQLVLLACLSQRLRWSGLPEAA